MKLDVSSIPLVNWDAVSAISTILIAVLGFVISRRIKIQEDRRSEFSLLMEYRREIIAYSERFFDLVSQAVTFNLSQVSEKKSAGCGYGIAAQLSSLIDQGRFVFPNDTAAPNDFGAEKGPAFEGARRPALDAIMAAHYAVLAMVETENEQRYLELAHRELNRTGSQRSQQFNVMSARSVLEESRRAYLNAIFTVTFPRKWHVEFQALLGRVVKSGEEI